MLLEFEKSKLIKKLHNIKCALGNVITFFINEGALYASTYNFEIQAKVKLIDCDDEDFGEIHLSKHIVSMIEKLPGSHLTLNFGANNLQIKCKTSKTNMKYVTYEPTHLKNENNLILLHVNDLKNKLKKASISVAKDKVLSAINIKVNDRTLMIRSCDSFRLSQLEDSIEDNTGIDKNINLNVPSLILKVLSSIEEDYKLLYNSNLISVVTEDTTYLIRMIEGNYPAVENFIPNFCTYEAKFNKKEMLDAIDRCSIFNERDNEYITLTISNNQIELSKNSEIGSSLEIVSAEYTFNSEIKASLSTTFLKAAINSYDNEDLKILINSDVKPVLIVDEKEESHVQLILPVKINN